MNKNKFLAMSAAAVMVASAGAMPVMAEGSDPSSKSADVKYNVTECYEWNIHPEIDFGENAGINQTVSKAANKVAVTENVLHEGAKLHITVRGSGTDGAFSITNGKTEVLSYAINNGAEDLAIDGTVLDVPAGTNVGDKDLEFKLSTTTKAAEVAGSYTGTVSYTAAIVE